MGAIHDVPKISRVHFESLTNLNESTKNSIPSASDLVKRKISSKVQATEMPGEIKTKANQAADKFPQIPETTLNKEALSSEDSEIWGSLTTSDLSVRDSLVNGRLSKYPEPEGLR